LFTNSVKDPRRWPKCPKQLPTVTKALRVRWNNGFVHGAGHVQVAGQEGRKKIGRLSTRGTRSQPAVLPPTPRLAALRHNQVHAVQQEIPFLGGRPPNAELMAL